MSKLLGVLAALLVLSGCSGAADLAGSTTTVDVASSTTTSDLGASSTEASAAAITYVAFGDSWPFGDHCNGCEPFPVLYAQGLEESTSATVEFLNFTEPGGTSTSLLEQIRTSDIHRDVIARSDVIVISTGANDLEPAFAAWQEGTCGGADELDCFRAVAEDWRTNFDGILDEIGEVRAGKPTAIRIVTNSNEFLADPALIEIFGADFGFTGGAAITAMHHDSLCAAAEEHGARCIDLRPVLNGPTFDRAQDVNTQEAMQTVADALVASGLAELDGD